MQRYAWPDGSRIYCRGCTVVRPHRVSADRGHVECEQCGKRTHGVEVVATYATDYVHGAYEVLLPEHAQTPLVYAAKFSGSDWKPWRDGGPR